MSAYSVFIKNINNLDGRSIASSDFRILNARIKNDALTKATSQITVLNLPSAVRIGDVVGVYDEYGTILYTGVINDIKGNSIGTDQINGIFNDNWLYNIPTTSSIENTLKKIIEDDYVNSSDVLMSTIFSKFDISTISNTALSLPNENEKTVKNMQSFIFEAYENYGILTNIEIPFIAERPTIKIGKPSYRKLLLGNNNEVLREFEINRETQETNKLVIYDKDGLNVRNTYYGTTTGITTDSASLNRLPKIKTKFIFSDDGLEDLVAQNLRNEMYNHKITLEAIVNNKLFNFNEFRLGQEADIYYNGAYYNSILTGFEMNISNTGINEVIKFTFGLVRDNLTSKLYKMYAN